jgi:hypothetical protein
MDDEQPRGPTTPDDPNAERPSPAGRPVRGRPRRWKLKVLGVFVLLLPLLVYAAWVAITLHWTYSRGERAGYVQKFSQKGWLCKTWEGEIAMVNMPGAAQERFAFTVRNDSVAQTITRLMGARVAITYEQHRGVPGSCFGETEYYVTAASPVP